MAKRPSRPKPFDVKFKDGEREILTEDLCREVDYAFSARSNIIGAGGEIDLADWFYEQGRSDPADRPFPGAADLTSYFITEPVDALRARLIKAIFGVRPFAFVEGWGQDAAKAPFVEEFTDWQVRKSGLKLELAKVIHGALIEDAYVLEVSEKIETRKIVEQLDVALELDPVNGGPVMAEGKPKLKMDADGEPVQAQDGEAAAKVERTHTKTRRLGPQYDAISMRDFVFLPGHAKSQKQVWGYAYRLPPKRVPELLEKVDDGIYDEDAVKALGDGPDGTREVVPPPVVDGVTPQEGPSVEKELFQLSIKRDLDGDGREEWYVATVSTQHRQLLRLKLDTFAMKVGRPRCVPFVLFPRRDSVYGYSFAYNKLLTLAEEHTALRNMKADRSNLATNAPMTVLTTALWDPDAEPIGVGRTIRVRQHTEVQQMQIPDVPNSVVEQEHGLFIAKERVSGLSDVAVVGSQSRQSNTLGQDQMIARASNVRVEEALGYLHAAIADVMTLSHAIWLEALEADPKGLDAPESVMGALKSRNAELTGGKFTYQQLKGDFCFEPYGSDENADPQRVRNDFDGFVIALTKLAAAFPGLQTILQSPEATKAVVEQLLRSYRVRDRQPFLGALQAPPMPPGVGAAGMGMPAVPGQPPGMPGGMPSGGPDIMALLAQLSGGGPGVGIH